MRLLDRRVSLTVRQSSMNNSAPTGRIFVKFYIWDFILKSAGQVQVWLNLVKNNRDVT